MLQAIIEQLDMVQLVAFSVALGMAFYWCGRARAAEAELAVTREAYHRALDSELDQARRLDDAQATLRLVYSHGKKVEA